MEPVEINAGAWYLRALRADERVDDGRRWPSWATGPDYIAAVPRSGSPTPPIPAVCEPTTGELVAEVVLDLSTAALTCRARAGYQVAAAEAEESVRRFAGDALPENRIQAARGRRAPG